MKYTQTFFLVLLIAFIFLVNVSSVSATQVVNQSYNLATSCSGFTCSTMRITVLYPNSTILANNVSMKDNQYYANYTLTPTTNGQYTYYYSDGINRSLGSFDVTPSGTNFNTASSLFYIALLTLIVFFFLGDIIAIARLPTGNIRADSGNIISINLIKYLKPALVVIAWGLIVSVLFISSSIAKNYLLDSSMSSFLFGFYKIASFLVYPMLMLGFAWMILMIFNDIKIKQLLDRGLSTQ